MKFKKQIALADVVKEVQQVLWNELIIAAILPQNF